MFLIVERYHFRVKHLFKLCGAELRFYPRIKLYKGKIKTPKLIQNKKVYINSSEAMVIVIVAALYNSF